MRTVLVFLFCAISYFANGQTYKMYATQNLHNQLRLNTATGEVKQIQDDGQSCTIGEAAEEYGSKDGRYCLAKTQNMWTFLMLDTYSGKTWQVQFSVKGSDYMFRVPLQGYSLAYPDTESIWTNRFQLTCGHLSCSIHTEEDYGRFNIAQVTLITSCVFPLTRLI